jgi:hypothetical protein
MLVWELGYAKKVRSKEIGKFDTTWKDTTDSYIKGVGKLSLVGWKRVYAASLQHHKTHSSKTAAALPRPSAATTAQDPREAGSDDE